MKKVLVTGGAGFIGSAILPELQRLGHEGYNLNPDGGTSMVEIICAIKTVIGVPTPYFLTTLGAGDLVAMYGNRAKAQRDLGWIQRYSVAEIMQTVWKCRKGLA